MSHSLLREGSLFHVGESIDCTQRNSIPVEELNEGYFTCDVVRLLVPDDLAVRHLT